MILKSLCPKCRAKIPLEDINVSTDLALCRRCGESWKYSELVEESTFADIDLARPPGGAWFKQVQPNGFEVGATTRSAGAFFLVPFMCVWSGGSLGGIYGSQIYHHKFDLLLSLFGIPFLLGTLVLGSSALMTVFGKVLVRIQGNDGLVFTGVGPVGWRRRFKWNEVSTIGTTEKNGNRGSASTQIKLEGSKRINLAAGIKEARMEFMLGALRQLRRRAGR